MGTRQVFRIFNGDSKLVASLFSNCSHSKQSAENVFWDEVHAERNKPGPNALLESLLARRYTSASGNHQKGDRIFWLVSAETQEESDIDALIEVTSKFASEQLAARRIQRIKGHAWQHWIRDGKNAQHADAP
ncbi:hypothetical protein ABIC83_002826 [Roseateles asaccharophilus]|uniref:hypothetical protein n=1 Tax=Roseateles asaccharophilus TaxID=582607 RepID=UPI00383906FD